MHRREALRKLALWPMLTGVGVAAGSRAGQPEKLQPEQVEVVLKIDDEAIARSIVESIRRGTASGQRFRHLLDQA